MTRRIGSDSQLPAEAVLGYIQDRHVRIVSGRTLQRSSCACKWMIVSPEGIGNVTPPPYHTGG